MLKYAWIAIVAAAALIACGGDEEAANPNFPAKGAASAALAGGPNGERIYKVRCITCHGANGDMGANGAANLQHSVLAVSERVQVITHGRKTMNAFKNILKPEEIKAVAEYTMTLSKA